MRSTSLQADNTRAHMIIHHQDLFGRMMLIQAAINSHIDPQWMGKKYNWLRAIWLKCASIMNQTSWQWWKPGRHDEEMIKAYLVDIWHFALSRMIEQGDDNISLASQYLKGDVKDYGHEHKEVFLQMIEQMARDALLGSFDLETFRAILHEKGITLEDLYKRYAGKAALNLLRVDLGYQKGSYDPDATGLDDNKVLIEILNKKLGEGFSFEGAYDELLAALSSQKEPSHLEGDTSQNN